MHVHAYAYVLMYVCIHNINMYNIYNVYIYTWYINKNIYDALYVELSLRGSVSYERK